MEPPESLNIVCKPAPHEPPEEIGFGPLSINVNINNSDKVRCASVKSSHSSVSRRISAVELEQLMIRQSTSSQFQPISPSEPAAQPCNGGPKKFTSVAEMKRRSQQRTSANQQSTDSTNLQHPHEHLQSPATSYGEPQDPKRRLVLRPKTPPPPPPLTKPSNLMKSASISVAVTKNGPPAPPPPPSDIFKPAPKASMVSTAVVPEPSKQPQPGSNGENHSLDQTTSSITSEALQKVKLRSVPQQKEPSTNIHPGDWQSDLKNALAKRRTKLNDTVADMTAKQSDKNTSADQQQTSTVVG